MRATMHNGRAGKSGVFLARHNDRDFDVSMAEHIRKDQSANNWTWHWNIKNDPNMTFEDTRRCREHFLDLCREHGLEIETDPKEASKTGLSLLEYQRRQEEEKLAEIEKKQADLKEAWNTKVTQANKVIAERAVRQNERENELNARESALDDLKTGLQAREGLLRANEVKQQARETELNALQSDLNERESSLRDREIKVKALYLSAEKKENDLKAQETALKALNEKLQANKAILTRKTQMIDRQASDLTGRESDLTARESDLDDRQKELLEILKKQMKRVSKLSEIELRMFRTISDRAESTDNLDDLETLIRALDQTKEGQTL